MMQEYIDLSKFKSDTTIIFFIYRTLCFIPIIEEALIDRQKYKNCDVFLEKINQICHTECSIVLLGNVRSYNIKREAS